MDNVGNFSVPPLSILGFYDVYLSCSMLARRRHEESSFFTPLHISGRETNKLADFC